jgi:S1-C subfamily serine protease
MRFTLKKILLMGLTFQAISFLYATGDYGPNNPPVSQKAFLRDPDLWDRMYGTAADDDAPKAPRVQKKSRKKPRASSSDSDGDAAPLALKRFNALTPFESAVEDRFASKFTTEIKRTIAKYIPQVVRIDVKTADHGHLGTGWVFNAEMGIIATNHHVATDEFCHYKVIMRNGTIYRGKDVELIGITPAATFGDYAFLRVRKLAGKFPQMPFNFDSQEKHDPVAFMGNSHGDFSIEEGNVNGLFEYGISKTFHSFGVQMLSRGGASGSPTFNRNGEINGILFGGGDIHTLICPIVHLTNAFNQIMAVPGKFSPVSIRSIGAPLDVENLSNISVYHDIDEELLLRYIPDDQMDEKKLIQFTRAFKGTTGDRIAPLDVLLRLEDQLIGADSMKMHALLEGKENVKLEVLRRGEHLNLTVFPRQITQKFKRIIKTDEESFVEVTDTDFEATAPVGSVVFSGEEGMAAFFLDDESDFETYISHIGKSPVFTFEEVALALDDHYNKKERDHLIVTARSLTHPEANVSEIDLSGMGRRDLIVELFDETTRHWKKEALKDYAARIRSSLVSAAGVAAAGGAGAGSGPSVP